MVGATVGNDPAREPCWTNRWPTVGAALLRRLMASSSLTAALEEQLRGVYRLYERLAGEDMEAATRRDYRTRFNTRRSLQ